MAAIGRLDVARSLKRLFELTGTYEPALGEGLVPTVELFDLEQTPFTPTVSWCFSTSAGAVLAEHSRILVIPGPSLGENGWVSVDEVWIHNTTAGNPQFVNIIASDVAAADIATLTLAATTPSSRRQPAFLSGSYWRVPEVEVYAGSDPTPINTNGMRWYTDALTSSILPVKVGLRRGAGLHIASGEVNQDLIVTLMGRVHTTTAK